MQSLIEYLKNGLPDWVYTLAWTIIFTIYFTGVAYVLIT